MSSAPTVFFFLVFLHSLHHSLHPLMDPGIENVSQLVLIMEAKITALTCTLGVIISVFTTGEWQGGLVVSRVIR